MEQEEKKLPEGLEEAARRYAIPTYMKVVDENFLDEYPYDPVAEKAFKAGAEWQKAKMLEEAVGCVITTNLANRPIIYLDQLQGFQYGDKVRVIVIKEDEK